MIEKIIFENWNKIKQKLHFSQKEIPFFYEREVWFCFIGQNIGFEQNGNNVNFCRPILILKKFGSFGFLGIPLTSNKKEGNWFHNLSVSLGTAKNSCLLLLQNRFFSSSRLSHKLGIISKKEFEITKKKIAKLYL